MPVLLEILTERARQDAQWGGPVYDDQHLVEDWVEIIGIQLASAGDAGEDSLPEARRRLINVAAMAVAAVEALDRKTHGR